MGHSLHILTYFKTPHSFLNHIFIQEIVTTRPADNSGSKASSIRASSPELRNDTETVEIVEYVEVSH